jgi:hypothetical protein
MFTSIDYDKFRALRVTHLATRFEELIGDETNDTLTPEQLFLTAVDDAPEQRRRSRVEKLIRQARFPIPHASVAEFDYRDGRGITEVRMRRYAAHAWRADPTNLLIISPTGGGKTYLACAIGISACLNEHTVTFARVMTTPPADSSSPAAMASPTRSSLTSSPTWICSSSMTSSPSASIATPRTICSRCWRTGNTACRR